MTIRPLVLAVTASLMGLLAPREAAAIINPKFTPADLVRTSGHVVVVTVSPPGETTVRADVVEAIKGKAPAPQAIEFAFDGGELGADELGSALVEGKPTTGLLLLSGRVPAGRMQVGTRWFTVAQKEGKWTIDRDEHETAAVWAGDAVRLAAGARAVVKDPTFSFPVKSLMNWGGEMKLGQTPGKPTGCVAVDFGGAIGASVVVTSEGGDQLYPAKAPAKPVALPTASKVATPVDLDGDGRIDLLSWDRKALRLAAQKADGTFEVRPIVAAGLTECLSLDAVGTSVVAGTAKGPVLISADGVKPVAPVDVGGRCGVADVDRDGHADVVQLSAKGLHVFRGDAKGGFGAASHQPIALPEDPRVATFGDYDADGRLDLIVVGRGGFAMLLQTAAGKFEDLTRISGELAYHGNANEPNAIGGAAVDVNADGRQGLAIFYEGQKPLLFFNRGFAAFGLARELDIAFSPDAPDPAGVAKPLELAGPLQEGQAAGCVVDVNGDAVPDLLAVTKSGEVIAITGEMPGRSVMALTLALPAKARVPVNATVRDAKRPYGTFVVRPGMPASVGLSEATDLDLAWRAADGTQKQRQVKVTKSERVELE